MSPNALPVHAPNGTRGKTTERGYGWHWQKVRRVFLAAHPLCERCAAGKPRRVTPSHHVHHKDHDPTGPRRFDAMNLEALCQACHELEHGRRKS